MGALQSRSGKLQNASQFPFIHFLVNREYCDEDGLWNPRESDTPLEDAFQINVFGSREHYLKLADMLRAFAERDTGDDGDYHEHFDSITSVDGKIRIDLILRKDDVGNSIFSNYFPVKE